MRDETTGLVHPRGLAQRPSDQGHTHRHRRHRDRKERPHGHRDSRRRQVDTQGPHRRDKGAQQAEELQEHPLLQGDTDAEEELGGRGSMGSRAVDPMSMSRILKEVRDFLTRDAIVVTSAGLPQEYTCQQFPMYLPRTYITSGGYSTDGLWHRSRHPGPSSPHPTSRSWT